MHVLTALYASITYLNAPMHMHVYKGLVIKIIGRNYTSLYVYIYTYIHSNIFIGKF